MIQTALASIKKSVSSDVTPSIEQMIDAGSPANFSPTTQAVDDLAEAVGSALPEASKKGTERFSRDARTIAGDQRAIFGEFLNLQDVIERLNSILRVNRIQAFLQSIDLSPLEGMANRLSDLATGGVNLTTSLEATGQAAAVESRRMFANYGYVGEELRRLSGQASSMSVSMQIGANEASEATYAWAQAQEELTAVGITSARSMAQFTAVTSVSGSTLRDALRGMRDGLEMTDEGLSRVFSSAVAFGRQAADIGGSINQITGLMPVLRRLQATGMPSDQVADYASQIYGAASGLYNITGDMATAQEQAMTLATTFLEQQETIEGMFSGTADDLGTFSQRLGIGVGDISHAFELIRQGPAGFLEGMQQMIDSVRGSGAAPEQVAQAMTFLRAQMRDALGPEMAANLQLFFDRADSSMIETMHTVQQTTETLGDVGRAGWASSMTLQDSFERVREQFIVNFRAIGRRHARDFVADTRDAFQEFTANMNRIVARGGPIATIIEQLSVMHQIGALALIPETLRPMAALFGTIAGQLIPLLPFFAIMGGGFTLAAVAGTGLVLAIAHLVTWFSRLRGEGQSTTDALTNMATAIAAMFSRAVSRATTFITGLAGSIASLDFSQLFAGGEEAGEGVISRIFAAFADIDLSALFGAFQRLGAAIIFAIGTIPWDRIGETVSTAFVGLFENVVQAQGVLNQVLSGLGGILTSVVTSVFELLGSEAAQNMITSLAEVLAQRVGLVIGILGDLLQAALPALLQTLSSLIPGLLGSVVGILTSLLETILPTLLGVIQELLPQISGLIFGLIDSLVGMLPDVLGGLMTSLVGILTSLLEAIIPSLLGVLQELLPQIPDLILDLVDSIIGMLPDVLGGLVTSLLGLVGTIIESLLPVAAEFIGAIIQRLPSLMGTIVQAIVTLVPQLLESLVGLLPSIASGLGGALSTLVESILSTIFGQASENNWMLQLFENVDVGEIVASLAGVIPQLVEGMWAIGEQVLLGMLRGARNAIAGAFGEAAGPVLEIFDRLISGVQGWYNFMRERLRQFTSLFSEVFGGVTEGVGEVGGIFEEIRSIVSPILEGWIEAATVFWTEVLFPIVDLLSSVLIPVFRFIGDVAAIVFGGIIRVMMWWFQNVVVPAWRFIGSILIPVFRFLGEVIGAVFRGIATVIRWWMNNIVRPVWGFIGDNLVSVFEWLGEVVVSVWRTISSVVTVWWNRVLMPVFRWLAERFMQRWGVIRDFVVDAFNRWVRGVTYFWNQYLIPFGRWLAEELPPIWERVREVATNLWNGLIEGINVAWNEYLRPFIEWVQTNVIPAWERIRTIAVGMWDRIAERIDQFRTIMSTLSGFVTTIWATITGEVSRSIDSMRETFSGISETFTEPFENLGDLIDRMFGNSVHDVVADDMGLTVDAVSLAGEQIASNITETMFNRFVESITEGFLVAYENVGDVTHGFVERTVHAFAMMNADIIDNFSVMWDSILEMSDIGLAGIEANLARAGANVRRLQLVSEAVQETERVTRGAVVPRAVTRAGGTQGLIEAIDDPNWYRHDFKQLFIQHITTLQSTVASLGVQQPRGGNTAGEARQAVRRVASVARGQIGIESRVGVSAVRGPVTD